MIVAMKFTAPSSDDVIKNTMPTSQKVWPSVGVDIEDHHASAEQFGIPEVSGRGTVVMHERDTGLCGAVCEGDWRRRLSLNGDQRDSDKTWDLGWVYTVIAGALNVLVIYDAVAGPAMGLEMTPRRSLKEAAA